MIIDLKIAFRNVLRNRRRSAVTASTVGLGACAVLLLGALMTYIVLDFQSTTVRRVGHLAVFQEGYFEYGAGTPAAFGISNYKKLIADIESDPYIAERVTVVTPMQTVFGIVGNYAANTSKTFSGQGVIPADRRRMRQWNGYGFDQYRSTQASPVLMNADSAIIGLGLGRVLHFCAELEIPSCKQTPRTEAMSDVPADAAISGLAARERGDAQPEASSAQAGPSIDLLASTALGAPNVVSLKVMRAEFQGIKDLDDSFVLMHLDAAQQLLYGRGEHKVTAIMIQLKQTDQLAEVTQRLRVLLSGPGQKFEIRDFVELTPLYRQALDFFRFIFTFVALVIGVIVLFTIANTMGMSVLERTSEIGTSRAMGVQRYTIRRQFVLEGALLGIFGATAGVVVAFIAVLAINHAGLTWTPPTVAGVIPLRLYLLGNPALVVGTWIVLSSAAALASLAPAHRAAHMNVVDALRYV